MRESASKKGEKILDQGKKMGRGIGFQMNLIICVGVAVIVGGLFVFVGDPAYHGLPPDGSRGH